jgi:hypothetical protein
MKFAQITEVLSFQHGALPVLVNSVVSSQVSTCHTFKTEEKENEENTLGERSCYYRGVYVHASIIGRTAAARNNRNKPGSLNDPKRKAPTSKRLPKSPHSKTRISRPVTGHHPYPDPVPILR